MKQSLQLRLGQQLTMTPQLQQAIRLLQLSALDIHTEIRQAVETNPLLELEETDNDPGTASPGNSASNLPENDYYQSMGTGRHEAGVPAGGMADDRQFDLPEQGNSLKEHLANQVDLLQLNDTDRLIATALIDCINDDGYLTAETGELLTGFDPALQITHEEVTAVLNRIQHLDPTGIGARDLRECLRLQLEQLDARHMDGHSLALRIINESFEALGQRDYTSIAKILDVSLDSVNRAVQLIQQLNPRPGNAIDPSPVEYIVPDVYVRKIGGRWTTMLNDRSTPRVRLNEYYASMIRRADDSRDNMFLKNNLQEARWFIKSLSNRNDTVLKVAEMIITQQRDFLEHGEEAMKPMVLRDIAEAIDMHESTISRVTTQKYMHTPRGIFEFKYFFSSHVNTANGGECSSTAIRAMIRKLVTSEDSRKPFSDNRLAQLLEQKGVKVARRTVAKYRESLLIPPSNERRLRA